MFDVFNIWDIFENYGVCEKYVSYLRDKVYVRSMLFCLWILYIWKDMIYLRHMVYLNERDMVCMKYILNFYCVSVENNSLDYCLILVEISCSHLKLEFVISSRN